MYCNCLCVRNKKNKTKQKKQQKTIKDRNQPYQGVLTDPPPLLLLNGAEFTFSLEKVLKIIYEKYTGPSKRRYKVRFCHL